MTDKQKVTIETKEETKEETKCICQSKFFRKFLVIALGTFVGVYSALCLFTALHRPMFPPQGFGPQFGMMPGCPIKYQMINHRGYHRFDKAQKDFRGDSHRPDKEHKQPAPFQEEKDD